MESLQLGGYKRRRNSDGSSSGSDISGDTEDDVSTVKGRACFYGTSCRNDACPFSHIPGAIASVSAPCRWASDCRSIACPFSHATPGVSTAPTGFDGVVLSHLKAPARLARNIRKRISNSSDSDMQVTIKQVDAALQRLAALGLALIAKQDSRGRNRWTSSAYVEKKAAAGRRVKASAKSTVSASSGATKRRFSSTTAASLAACLPSSSSNADLPSATAAPGFTEVNILATASTLSCGAAAVFLLTFATYPTTTKHPFIM